LDYEKSGKRNMILISPRGDRETKLGAFAKYVPLSVPYGIGALAGYLRYIGEKAIIIDEEIERITTELLKERIKQIDPPFIIGISCLTAGFFRGIEIAKIIRNNRELSNAIIVFGGIHPTVLPEETLKSGYVDIVVRNEGEITLGLLYNKIKNRESYSKVKGISFRVKDQIIYNDSGELIDLDTLPSFPYDLFYNYSSRYSLGFITSSRGCPYNCIFCSQRSISGTFYRFRKPETVIEEIEYLHRRCGQNYITFQDDNFLPNKKRAMKLCDMIITKFGNTIHFDCQARADNIDEEVLEIMKHAGFRIIHLGIECASDRLLNLIQKGETLEQIIKGVQLIKKHGMRVSGTFILGLPTETERDRRAAYLFAKELDLDFVRFNNATPYPGTRLLQLAQTQGTFNPGERWENMNACGSLAENPFQKNSLSFVPDGVSEEKLRNDIIKYNMFYSLRPKKVFSLIFERIGPAGWFEMPPKWFLKPKEWSDLGSFSIKIGINFLLMLFASIKFKLHSIGFFYFCKKGKNTPRNQ